jgi:hypothetical protein
MFTRSAYLKPHACRWVARATTTSSSGAHPAANHPVVYHPDFQINPVPDGHRFPMPKDHLLYVALQQAGWADMTFTPTYPDASTISLAHDPAYVNSFLDGSISQQQMRRIGLPWSEQLVRRTLIGTGSAILAARLALQYGVACMTNGGTHHAHPDHGSGEQGSRSAAAMWSSSRRQCQVCSRATWAGLQLQPASCIVLTT